MEGMVMRSKRRKSYDFGSLALTSPLARALRAGDSQAQQKQGATPDPDESDVHAPPPGYKHDVSKPDRRQHKRV